MLPSVEFYYFYEKHPKKFLLQRLRSKDCQKFVSDDKFIYCAFEKRSLLDSVHVCIYPPIHPPIESKAIVSQFLLH